MKRGISLFKICYRSLSTLLPVTALAACAGDLDPARLVMAGPDSVPDGWMVELAAATPPDDVAAIAGDLIASTGGSVRHLYTAALLGFAADGLDPDQAAALARDPRVVRIEQDRHGRTDRGPAGDIAYAVQTTNDLTLDRLDQRMLPASCSYRYQPTGAGVDVYVIDSGVRTTHVEFEGRARALFDATTGQTGTATDNDGHGTAVASLIGGKTFGVAKGVNLFAVKVYDRNATARVSDFTKGVDFVASRVRSQRAAGNFRPAVANLSIGAPRIGTEADAFTTAINNLSLVGVEPVVADAEAASPSCEAQAFAGNAIAVGGSDARTDQRSAGGSPCVDIYAPTGASAASSSSDTAVRFAFSGTSGAAPRVAGIAALHLEQFPAATVQSPALCPLTGTPNPQQLTCSIVGLATRDRVIGVPFGDRTNRLAYSRLAVDPAVTVSRSALTFSVPVGTVSPASAISVGVASGTERAEYRIDYTPRNTSCPALIITPAPNATANNGNCRIHATTATDPAISVKVDGRCLAGSGPALAESFRVAGTNGVAHDITVMITGT